MIQNQILFRNKKGIFEDYISLYFLTLSIADGIVILIGMAISSVLWGVIVGDSSDFDIENVIISLIPILLSLVLVMPKPTVTPLYITILSVLTLKKEKRTYAKSRKKIKSKSTILGFADNLKIGKTPDKDIPMEYLIDELDTPRRIKLNIYKENGDKLSDHFVKIYVDELLIDSILTSLDGQIELDITPRTYGRKKLVIKNRNDEILHMKYLDFIEKDPF